jgi:hypothetical protein
VWLSSNSAPSAAAVFDVAIRSASSSGRPGIEHDGLEFGFRQTNVWDCFVALLSVEYRLSPLGQSALGPLAGLIDWAERSFAEIKAARAAFDAGDTSEQMSAA